MATVKDLPQTLNYPSKVKVTVNFDEQMMGMTAKEYFSRYRAEGGAKSDVGAINYALSKSDEISSSLDVPKMMYIPIEFSTRQEKVFLLGFDLFSIEDGDTVNIDDAYIEEGIVVVSILKGGNEL